MLEAVRGSRWSAALSKDLPVNASRAEQLGSATAIAPQTVAKVTCSEALGNGTPRRSDARLRRRLVCGKVRAAVENLVKRGRGTMYQSLIINGGHLALATAGAGAIVCASRSPHYSRFLWPVAIAASTIVALFLFFVSDPGTIFEDFRKAYWVAGSALVHPPHNIDHVFDNNLMGFVNLPIVALLFAPFGLFDERFAGVLEAIPGALAVIYSWWALCNLCGMNKEERALTLLAFASFGPLIHSIRQGNSSHFLLAVLLWGLLRAGSKPGRAGAAMALAALIKPPLALLGVYYVLRRQWRLVAAFSATLAALGALSVFIFGWQLHVVWYENSIRPFMNGAVAGFNAQSLPAALTRLELGPSTFWDWSAHTLSPPARAVQILASLGIIGAAIWASLGAAKSQVNLEFAMVLVLVCVLSSLTWSHYYLWMLPALALLFINTRPGAAPEFRPYLIAAFVLSAPAEFLSTPMREGAYPLASILVSHLLWGGLITFAAIVGVRRKLASAAAHGPAAVN